MNLEELTWAYDVVKGSDRVVQMGTQMRSYPQSNGARQFIQKGGLGKILRVEQARNGYEPYWQSYGGEEFASLRPRAEDVDWNAFLMNRDKRPFDPVQYQNWYGFRDFSGGPHTNLAVHFIDLMHFVNGVSFPKTVMAQGGTFRWHGPYTTPDSVEVSMEYPEGFMVRYSTVFGNSANSYAKWFGTLGTLDAQSLSGSRPWTVSGDGSREEDRLKSEATIEEPTVPHHMVDWFNCIRNSTVPIASIEAGYSHALAVIMADESFTSGRRVGYDPVKRRLRKS
ncbi:MAG TPA: Gfo/Idh/MocA family oxidoreductase [Acidobacteriota bacterium]|nr:Gfo/Idh/MocA family oxidoreductase [Acidobacteriota bacterium]